jgi:hypothetical protein
VAAPTGVGFAIDHSSTLLQANMGVPGTTASGALFGAITATGIFRMKRGETLTPYAYCGNVSGTFSVGCYLTIAYIAPSVP